MEENIWKPKKTAFVFKDIIMTDQYVDFMISFWCSELSFLQFHGNKFVLAFTEQTKTNLYRS